MEKRPYNLLIAATGSVAALKIPLLVESLQELSVLNEQYYFEINLIVTEHAKHFVDVRELPPDIVVYDDNTEWQSWKDKGDPVVHIDLGKWANMMVIAPLDANTLAKMAQGLCDNLLTCTIRAWDFNKPLLFCPAMNTRMWEHPITSRHLTTLKEWGYTEIPPISKLLVCGEEGMGAMAEVETITKAMMTFIDQ